MIAAEPQSGTLIFCQGRRKGGQICKTILGSSDGEKITVRHRGREITGVQSIRCENCGWVWQRGAGQ